MHVDDMRRLTPRKSDATGVDDWKYRRTVAESTPLASSPCRMVSLSLPVHEWTEGRTVPVFGKEFCDLIRAAGPL
jgi:hypothetical protein